jgi:hypothetical protein
MIQKNFMKHEEKKLSKKERDKTSAKRNPHTGKGIVR